MNSDQQKQHAIKVLSGYRRLAEKRSRDAKWLESRERAKGAARAYATALRLMGVFK